MKIEKVILGGKVFSCKIKAKDYLCQIKDTHGPGDFLTGDEATAVLDALQRHPACAEKVGFGVQRVGLYRNGDTLSGYGFGVERVDGTVSRFSYHTCFSAERRSYSDRVLEAFRQAVRPYILQWRKGTFDNHNGQIKCPITGEIIDQHACHVDHFSPTFSQLVAAFLVEERLLPEQIMVDVSHGAQVEAVLSDPALRKRWVRFHNPRVKLRILSVEGHRLHHK